VLRRISESPELWLLWPGCWHHGACLRKGDKDAVLRRCPAPTQVTVAASCIDTITGVGNPFPATGIARSSGTFFLSAAATIATASLSIDFAQASLSPSLFSYSKLTNFDPLTSDLDALDGFGVMQAGKFAESQALLEADYRFIVASEIISAALPTTSNCSSRAALQQALASWVAGLGSWFDVSNDDMVRLAITSFMSPPCSLSPTALPSSRVATMAAKITGLVGLPKQVLGRQAGWLADQCHARRAFL
jgi:hypothetical protein